jgi:mRNA-degrading endonuclease toxin of MazEF toxin-antitoxin module
VPQLCRGRIVWVELLDPQGHNRKSRPAVIVTPDADIQADGEVWVVAISTQVDETPVEARVELPWDHRGHPRTKLKERCVAVCTWMAKVKVADIRELAGLVPGRQLLDILTRIKPVDPSAQTSSTQ